ncbi:3'3'-cGAMP-specific phosphodiesterase 1 [Peribacillus sp. Bi96]|uniref:HD-GYP domain-containing protein n=1 Tax=Peribacillus sp. Bi96 TaxID=2884273 RepID=UPI001D5CB2B7|nr:HD domain-containing phosphohydrolase [Peribacillus sp. Bi96]CAH0297787.1 3'3'-cGAMP-specific phosphodiesterase 1 [Peribacillus sp. Bi96]
MLVKTRYLIEGCILSFMIRGLSDRPIMNEKTILTKELIEALQAFLIMEVSVDRTLIDGKKILPKEVIDPELDEMEEFSDFTDLYLKSVQTYKRLFKNWQAGSRVEVAMIRLIVIPLVDKALEEPGNILMLHHYCNKEDYLFHHAISIGLIGAYIASKMKCNRADVYQVAIGGCLADCGMAKLPPRLLTKTESLTVEDYEEIHNHPIFSYKMIKDSSIIKDSVKTAILEHHGRLDGTGYPKSLKTKPMSLFSKIIAVADVFHAMTSERTYRKKQSPFKVLEMILHDGFGKFDMK